MHWGSGEVVRQWVEKLTKNTHQKKITQKRRHLISRDKQNRERKYDTRKTKETIAEHEKVPNCSGGNIFCCKQIKTKLFW